MKSFGLCHEIISPVILKSFGLSQDLPLSQNGQNFRRGNLGDGANEANEATGANGANGKWAWLRGLIRPSSLNWPSLYFSTFLPSWIYILPFSGWVTLLPLRSYQSSSLACTLTLPILAGEDFSLTPPLNTCGVQPAAI